MVDARGVSRQPSQRGGVLSISRICAVLLGFAALALAAPAAEAKPVFGIVSQDGAIPSPSDLDLMPTAGISSIRVLFHWASIERNQGVYDWVGTDEVMRQATSHGIQPFPFLSGMPEWAARQDGHDCTGGACWNFFPSSSQTRTEYANFAAAAVARYGPNGDFWTKPSGRVEDTNSRVCSLLPICPPDPPPPPPIPPLDPGQPPCQCTVAHPVRTWQIWNEQNSPKYYAPKPDPRQYAAGLAPVGAAIHAKDPGADVVVGGMWGPDSAKKVVMPVTDYLHKLYQVKGIESAFDSIAVHPYASQAENSIAAVEDARRVVKQEGDSSAGTWITEIGWATGGPHSDPYVKSPSGQAKELSKALGTFKKKSRSFRLRGVFWYSWRDRPGGNLICEWCGHAGLRAKDGSAKPSWRAFRRIAGP